MGINQALFLKVQLESRNPEPRTCLALAGSQGASGGNRGRPPEPVRTCLVQAGFAGF